MSKSNNKQFDYESYQDNDTIANYLSALIDGFKNGKISLQSKTGDIILNPNNLLQFSMKARQKDEKSKITIKIEWKNVKQKLFKENTISIN